MFRNLLVAMALCLSVVPDRVFSQEADLTYETGLLRILIAAGGQINFGSERFPSSVLIGGKTIVYSFFKGKIDYRVVPAKVVQFEGDYALSVERDNLDYGRVRVFSVTDSVRELTPHLGIGVVGGVTKLVASSTGQTYLMSRGFGYMFMNITDYYTLAGDRIGSIMGLDPTFMFGENAVVTREFVGRVSGNDNFFERVNHLDLNTGKATSTLVIVPEGNEKK